MSRRRRKRRRRKEPPTLFDLPLHPEPSGEPEVPEQEVAPKAEIQDLPMESTSAPALVVEVVERDRGETHLPEPSRQGIKSRRFVAGLIDLLLPALVIVPLIGWTKWAGGTISVENAIALGGFCLLLLYIYHTVTIAFWGRTPGMKQQGLRVQSKDGRHPSLAQVTRRWWGGLLALLPLGLGCLWLLSGASWPDRLSGTHVIVASGPEHC